MRKAAEVSRDFSAAVHLLIRIVYSKKQIQTNFDLRNSSDLLRLVTRTGIRTRFAPIEK